MRTDRPEWPLSMRTSEPWWPINMRTSEPGWLKRWTPPSRRFSLKQSQLTQSGCFPVASPLAPILVLFPHVTWIRHWILPYNEEQMSQWLPPLQSLGAHRPWPPLAVWCTKLRLHLFPFFPCQTFPPLAPPSRVLTHWSPAHKAGSLTQWCH